MKVLPKGFWKRRWKWAVGGGVIAVTAVILLGARLANTEPRIPTSTVVRGTFQDTLALRGEVKARRSVVLNAPMRAGQLMIIKMAPDGTSVKKGDAILQFDASKLEQTLSDDKSALATAEAQIQQSAAQAQLTDQADLTDLMKAKYTLQSAQLDASKAAILSEIDGKEAEIKVTDAELAVKQAQEKLKMDRAAAAADLADQKEKRGKARFDVQRDATALAQMSLRAPLDGVVTVLSHWTPNGPHAYRTGEQVWPGAAIVELPDLSTLFFNARADEIDRSRLKIGQTALIRVDALPGQEVPCSISQISTLASMDFSASWPFPRNFEVEVSFHHENEKLRPGMSATARVAVGQIAEAIQIPTQAVFQKNGRSVAYVLRGSKFEAQPIQVGQRSEGMVVVATGLTPGERVAMEDPTSKE
jgi:HlyD family secretion protein